MSEYAPTDLCQICKGTGSTSNPRYTGWDHTWAYCSCEKGAELARLCGEQQNSRPIQADPAP